MEHPIRLICGECEGRGFKVDSHYKCPDCHGKGDLNEEVEEFYALQTIEMAEATLKKCINMLERLQTKQENYDQPFKAMAEVNKVITELKQLII